MDDYLSQESNKEEEKKREAFFLLRFFKKILKFPKNGFLRIFSFKKEAEQSLVYSLSKNKTPNKEQFKHLFKILNPRERMILKLFIFIFILSISFILYKGYQGNLQAIPAYGGKYTEGLLSYPQTINPLYANNRDVDADLNHLIYSSLFKYNENAILEADLASSWEILDDGLSYLVNIKESVKWHNGDELLADDIVFTFNLIKDQKYRSPLRISFSGVEIEKVSEYSVVFHLGESYADFLSLLDFGILPKNIWSYISPDSAQLSEFNLKPIGSGPYKFLSLSKNKGGEIKEYQLQVNEEYYNEVPFIEKLIFKFYPNYTELINALNNNELDAVAYVPEEFRDSILAKRNLNIYKLQYPQINSLFFNQTSNSLLAKKSLRKAMGLALDKDYINEEILFGFAEPINSPILAKEYLWENANALGYDLKEAQSILAEDSFSLFIINNNDLEIFRQKELAGLDSEEADESEEDKLQLEKGKLEILKFAKEKDLEALGHWLLKEEANETKIAYFKLVAPENSNPELLEYIKTAWEKIGIRIELEVLDSAKLNTEIIPKQEFEILFYGQVVGWEPDLVSFWLSSQLLPDGLNLASYKNTEVDKILLSAREESLDYEKRKDLYREFQEKIFEDFPTIFLFSPKYFYAQTKQLKGFEGTAINTPSDRFASIAKWHVKTKKRLKYFFK